MLGGHSKGALAHIGANAVVHAINDTDDVALWYELHRLETRYWFDVDFHGGCNAHEFYAADGLFIVGENRFQGHDRIRAFYQWRQSRGYTTSRHLISNLRVSADGDGRGTLIGVLSLYRADGRPPFHGERPPMLIADLTAVCKRGEDKVWRYQSHVLEPLFVGRDIPLSISIDTEVLAEIEHGRERHRSG